MKSHALLMSLFVVALSTCAISPAHAAVDAFLWFDSKSGDIVEPQGGGLPPIDVASFQWDVSGGISSPSIGSTGQGIMPSILYNVVDTAPANFPASSVFEVLLGVKNPGIGGNGGAGGAGGNATGGAFVVPGGGANPSFFDVFATLNLADGAHYLDLHYALNPDQTGLAGISASAIGVNANGVLDVTVGLFGNGGPVDSGQPLFSVTMTSVPEPSTFVLAGVGLLSMGFAALRRLYRQV